MVVVGATVVVVDGAVVVVELLVVELLVAGTVVVDNDVVVAAGSAEEVFGDLVTQMNRPIARTNTEITLSGTITRRAVVAMFTSFRWLGRYLDNRIRVCRLANDYQLPGKSREAYMAVNT